MFLPQSGTGDAPAVISVPIEIGDAIRPLDDYQDVLMRRNPFRLESQKRSTTQRTQELSTEVPLQKKVSTLSVVGVNRGKVPEALIEDRKTSRTYFVKVGDTVNGVMVEAINENGVLVSLDGESTYLP